MLTPQQRTHLRDLVAQCFSNDELKAFCFEFGLDAETLIPEKTTKIPAIEAIILWLENRGQLDLLLGWARRERPLADWDGINIIEKHLYPIIDDEEMVSKILSNTVKLLIETDIKRQTNSVIEITVKIKRKNQTTAMTIKH